MAIIMRKAKNGKNRYLVRVRDNFGSWYPSRTFERRVDAERYERELESSRDNGSQAIPRERREVKVEEFFRDWLQARKHKISETWLKAIEQMASSYILPSLGKYRLTDVEPRHIGKAIADMAELGRSPQTRVHVFGILRQMFGDAVEYYGILSASPVLKRDRPKIHRVERAYLKPEQSWRLLRASQSHYLAPAIWLSILTGLRPSEVQALKWSSVDLDKGQILIREAYKRGIRKIQPFPKQKDWGSAPIPAALEKFLRDREAKANPGDFVAQAMHGGMLEQKKFHDGLKRLCETAGVPKVSPHELRHSCTEIWFSMGASMEDVRRLLNHKSAETTKRYVHRTDERLLALAEKITMPKPDIRAVR